MVSCSVTFADNDVFSPSSLSSLSSSRQQGSAAAAALVASTTPTTTTRRTKRKRKNLLKLGGDPTSSLLLVSLFVVVYYGCVYSATPVSAFAFHTTTPTTTTTTTRTAHVPAAFGPRRRQPLQQQQSFLTPHPLATTIRSSATTTRSSSSTQLHASSTSVSRQQQQDPTQTQQQQPTSKTAAVLSHEDQHDLLRHAVELRRIQQIQRDLLLEVDDLLLLQQQQQVSISRAAGYGDEIELLQQAVEQGKWARQQLVTTNMGLVHHVVQSILGGKNQNNGFLKSLTREDLIQEGAIGLSKAVDRWNPEIGGKFSSYAYYWIRSSILRGIAQRDGQAGMRVPEYLQGRVLKLQKAARHLGVDLSSITNTGSTSTTSEEEEKSLSLLLAQEAGLTGKQLQQALQLYERRRNGMLSFESWMEGGKDVSSENIVPQRQDQALLDETSTATTNTNTLEDLQSMLAKYLRPRELEALSWRYGLVQDYSSNKSISISNNMNNQKLRNKRNGRDYVAEAEEQLFGVASSTGSTFSHPQEQPLQQQQRPKATKATTRKIHTAQQPTPPTQGKWGEAMSFVEVGKRMQVSAEYGRRLCHSALEKLRRAAEEGSLALEPAMVL